MLRWRSSKEIPVTINSIALLKKKGLWKVFNVILLLLLLFTKYSQLSPCGHYGHPAVSVISLIIRDGPLENLLGGGEVQKKYSRKGKLNEKKKTSCTPINPKKYSCYDLKKKSYKEFDNAKKIPPP